MAPQVLVVASFTAELSISFRISYSESILWVPVDGGW